MESKKDHKIDGSAEVPKWAELKVCDLRFRARQAELEAYLPSQQKELEEDEKQPKWEADFEEKYPILTKLDKMSEADQKAWLVKQLMASYPKPQKTTSTHDFLKGVVTGQIQLYKKM